MHEFCSKQPVHFVEVGAACSEEEIKVLSLKLIFDFCEMMAAAQQEHQDKPIIVCPESLACSTTKNVVFLIGAFLMARCGNSADAVKDLFESVIPLSIMTSKEILPLTKCMDDGLKALQLATHLSWLQSDQDFDEDVFDIERSLHYANEANGNIHTLVPGKLLYFLSPHSLQAYHAWVDVCEASGRQTRQFSADYLADLLLDLDVSVVACLSECSSAHAAAFADHGLDVHDLRLDPRRPSMLRAMDRLLALARAAPGAVAVFCGGDGGAEWPAHVGTLAAAYLMSDFGFDAAAADAWLLMVCPLLCCGGAASLAGLEAGDGAAGVA